MERVVCFAALPTHFESIVGLSEMQSHSREWPVLGNENGISYNAQFYVNT